MLMRYSRSDMSWRAKRDCAISYFCGLSVKSDNGARPLYIVTINSRNHASTNETHTHIERQHKKEQLHNIGLINIFIVSPNMLFACELIVIQMHNKKTVCVVGCIFIICIMFKPKPNQTKPYII